MKYKMVQIPEDAYILLKEYCKNNNLKMGGYIGTLIKKNVNIKVQTSNILKVDR
jgi:hypothetical protein